MVAEAAPTVVDVVEAVVEMAPFVVVVEVMVEAEEVIEAVQAVQVEDEEPLVGKYTCKWPSPDEKSSC